MGAYVTINLCWDVSWSHRLLNRAEEQQGTWLTKSLPPLLKSMDRDHQKASHLAWGGSLGHHPQPPALAGPGTLPSPPPTDNHWDPVGTSFPPVSKVTLTPRLPWLPHLFLLVPDSSWPVHSSTLVFTAQLGEQHSSPRDNEGSDPRN